ncbi:MAG TPA: PKD domain-containing protein [Gemmatimonadaceae bacterium]
MNSYVDAEAMDDYSASTISSAPFVTFMKEAGDTMTYFASPMLSGYPGNYKAPDDPTRMVDSLNVAAGAMNGGGFSEAWKILPGAITNVSQSVTGPAYVVTGSSATWRSIPDWDTTGYTYRWLLDGTTIASAQGAQYQNIFGTSGTYSLSNVATRADNSSDTVTRTVTVGPALDVSIDGPTLIQPGATCSWNAVISNGTSPYAYEWQSQGQGVVGYDEYYTGAKEPGLGATFDLQVSATDSHGAPGLAQITVTEDSSAPVCEFSPSPTRRPSINPHLTPSRTPRR